MVRWKRVLAFTQGTPAKRNYTGGSLLALIVVAHVAANSENPHARPAFEFEGGEGKTRF